MASDKKLNWYETSLSTQERKVRGHFSTPPALVEAILDACGYTSDKTLSSLRVLDPACGSGNFLVGAARRLLVGGSSPTFCQSIDVLRNSLWGFDPDPVACFLAEMQLRSLVAEQVGGDERLNNLESLKDTSRSNELGLHIHQADGLAFPWEQACSASIDLFLANPPYLAAKNTDLSEYRAMQEFGQADSYLFFLRLALQVVRPGGWIGLVLPDPVLARANAARERRRLLQEATLHQLWHLSNVFPAYVGAVVLIAQKRAPTSTHAIAWTSQRWSRRKENVLPASERASVSQQLLSEQAGAELRYLLGNERASLLQRLYSTMTKADVQATLVPLDTLISIRRGEELGKKSPLLVDTPPVEAGWRPLLLGGVDVRPYTTPKGRYWIAETALEKPLSRYCTPKLLVVKSTNLLQAALDLYEHVTLQTLYILQLKGESATGEQKEMLYFLLALLNSRLLQRYVYVLHTAYKLVQPQIEQHVLAHLPIPVAMPGQRRDIAERARRIMLACSQGTPVVELKHQLLEEQELAICTLYENALDMPSQ